MLAILVGNAAYRLTITKRESQGEIHEKCFINSIISHPFPQAGKSPMPVVERVKDSKRTMNSAIYLVDGCHYGITSVGPLTRTRHSRVPAFLPKA